MMRHIRLGLKALSMEFAREMAYKWNFILKAISIGLVDIISPLVMLIIYTTTSGIPGWSFHEFILFQGTFTLVFGIINTTIMWFPERVIAGVRRGSLDKHLIKPFNPLAYFLLTSWNLEGFAGIIVGLALITWAAIKLNLVFLSLNTIAYILLLIVALFFFCSMMIIISALAVIFVRSQALYQLFFSVTRFTKFPLDIYSSGLFFALTFIFPIGIAAFYPVEALLGSLSLLTMVEIVIPIAVFFGVSLILWRYALKKYTSAGG